MATAEVAAAWASVVSAAVALIAAIASAVLWWRARGERAESARQAGIATESAGEAASALTQIAELQRHQHDRQQATAVAQERDPWIFHHNSGDGTLTNDSQTPKYGVTIKILANDQDLVEETFDYVGPGRSKGIDYTELLAEMQAVVTWHQLEDQSDTQPPQIFTW